MTLLSFRRNRVDQVEPRRISAVEAAVTRATNSKGSSSASGADAAEARLGNAVRRLAAGGIITLPVSKSLGIWVIVKGQIPKGLLPGLQRDFTEAELTCIYSNIYKDSALPSEKPAALFVFGPPAVGKSTLCNARANELFGSSSNAVLIDGSEFRDVHSGYQAVAQHGTQRHVLHADAWPLFKATKASAKLKQRVFREAILSRQHLLIPDCAAPVAKVEEMLEQLIAAGYELHAICLWAPLSVTRARGEPRSLREGKLWSPKMYLVSTHNSLNLAQRFAEACGSKESASKPFKSFALWDNTTFPARQISLEEFELLSHLPVAEAEACAAELRAAAAEAEDADLGQVGDVDDAAAWRGRTEGLVVGTVLGAVAGGSLHAPLAACAIL